MTKFYEPPDDLRGTIFDPSDETFGPLLGALQSGDFETALRLLKSLVLRVGAQC